MFLASHLQKFDKVSAIVDKLFAYTVALKYQGMETCQLQQVWDACYNLGDSCPCWFLLVQFLGLASYKTISLWNWVFKANKLPSWPHRYAKSNTHRNNKYLNLCCWQPCCRNDLQSSDQLSELLTRYNQICSHLLFEQIIEKLNTFFMNTSNVFSSLIILTLKFHFNNPILQALQTLKVLKQKLS